MENDRQRIELTSGQAGVLQSIAEGRGSRERGHALVARFGFRRLVVAMLSGIENGQIPDDGIRPFTLQGLPAGESRVAAAIFSGKTDDEIITLERIKPLGCADYGRRLLDKSGAENKLQFAAQMAKGLKLIGTLRYHVANMRRS